MEGEFIKEVQDFVWNVSLECIKLCTQCRCKGYEIERVVGLGQNGVEPVTFVGAQAEDNMLADIQGDLLTLIEILLSFGLAY